jgi:hypothetical protein
MQGMSFSHGEEDTCSENNRIADQIHFESKIADRSNGVGHITTNG